MPVPDDVLTERAQELGLLDEEVGIDVVDVREMLLPLAQLVVLTGYSRVRLGYLCRVGSVEGELRREGRGTGKWSLREKALRFSHICHWALPISFKPFTPCKPTWGFPWGNPWG